ncbi:putative serine/threonine-kinase pknI domain protein [Mycobacterium kansasii 824]|nr:putative serine/threonine-kinase pknI domain protein [Mycobacterium kansasii 824]
MIEAFPGYHDVPKASTPAWVTGSPPAAARRKKRSQPWILLAATMAMAVLIVVGVIGYRMIQNNTAAKPPAAAEPPPAAVLEGTYRVDIDWAKQTENGAPASSSDKTNSSSWWAFRSFCSSTGCVASGTVLDDTNHQVAATPRAQPNSILSTANGSAHPLRVNIRVSGAWAQTGKSARAPRPKSFRGPRSRSLTDPFEAFGPIPS